MRVRLLSPEQVRAAVPMPRAIDAVRAAFTALAADEFELPPRTALGDGRFLVMPARHTPSETSVVKSISVDLTRRPSVRGTVTYAAANQDEVLLLDAEAVTSLRTGAVAGVATAALAPADATRLTLIGLGGQAADQLRAVRAVRSIDAVTLVGRRQQAAEAFAVAHEQDLAGTAVHLSQDVVAAVAAADVVCCATPAIEPLFPAQALAARCHVNAIGSFRRSMRELPIELLADALVVVDLRSAALVESGEIHDAVTAGRIAESDLVELGALDVQRLPGSRPDRTVFKSVGLAIQDWAIAHAVATATRHVT